VVRWKFDGRNITSKLRVKGIFGEEKEKEKPLI
jgi:hypothetical protein